MIFVQHQSTSRTQACLMHLVGRRFRESGSGWISSHFLSSWLLDGSGRETQRGFEVLAASTNS